MTQMTDDIRAALVAAGVGQVTSSDTDWMIYQDFMPDKPDRAIALFETGGEAPLPSWAVDKPGLQVLVRAKADEFVEARAQLKLAFTVLHDGEAAVGAAYTFIQAVQSGAIPLGPDENRRPRFAQNYRMMKTRA